MNYWIGAVILASSCMLNGCGGGSNGSVVDEGSDSDPALTLVAAYPQLPALAAPVAMLMLPGDDAWWFSVSRLGRIDRFSNQPEADVLMPVVDLSERMTFRGEMGLTGAAIHPNYPQDPRIFLIYNARGDGESILSSFVLAPDNYQINPASERVLLRLEQPATNHNGGDLAFGLDGMLYAAFGDGGADREQSQRLSNLYGAVIRLDVGLEDYRIPSDNPFQQGQSRCTHFDASRSDVCPEIYGYGFRNPWRLSIDRQTGAIWLGDVGQHSAEEVNHVRPGGNYGWPVMEGESCYSQDNCDSNALELPHSYYDLRGTQAVAGGYVYRGRDIPKLTGHYIFWDIYGQTIYSTDITKPGSKPARRLTTGGRLMVGMAEDHRGELYGLNFEGGTTGEAIYRLQAQGPNETD